MLTVATAVSLVAIAAMYLAGLRRLWRKSIQPWQAAAFGIGWGATAVALLSPLDAWSDVFFSVHMAQHEILMLIGAPLMVLGRPNLTALHVAPPLGRLQRVWELVTGPVTVLVAHAVVLWMWHVPALFEAALHDETIHAIQHLGFFITAALFWFALLHGRYGRLGYGAGIVYVFITAMHTQLLGALLTFTTRIWYPTHAARTAAAGVSAVDDQQLAGVLMWVPFGVVFLCVALAMLAAWLGEAERRAALLLVVVLIAGACRGQDDHTARQLTGGDPSRGKELIQQHGCGACHTIPGVRGANALVGPPLSGIADRTFLAGQLPNTPDNMKRWIRNPQSIENGTAMPDMGVTEGDARHIAAYLYTLRAQ